MKKAFLFLILFFTSFIMVDAKEINIHLFYGKECVHCKEEMKFLQEYINEKDNIKLYKYEVWHNQNNQNRLIEVKELLETKENGIPFLVIGNQVISGYYAKYTNQKIKDVVSYYEENDYRDLVGEYVGVTEINEDIELVKKEITSNFNLPILGEVNPKNVSLPLLSVVMGFVDGFNPCAMWILIFLISMLFGMKDKKKMWILGLTFIMTSGLVYLLFMVSWLNLAIFISKVNYIKIGIGLFAIIFGGINIYNYFKALKKDDGCTVVNDKKRKKIITFVKKIIIDKKFIVTLLGIMLLAISVNIIELLCSLGLPVIFTQVLSLNNLTALEYIIYMFLYIIFFLIDDIVIFTIAMKTLHIKGISNKYAKYSHLIGGLIMLILGILMIFKPEWLMFNF